MSITGDRLKQLLTEHGHDQSDLAREIGISQGAISLIVRGKTRNSHFLADIAAYYGVSHRWLQGHDVVRHDDTTAVPLRQETVRLDVVLPSQRALSRMFDTMLGLLDRLPDKPDQAERARLLAKWLPIGLSQLHDLLPDKPAPVHEGERELAEALAIDPRESPS